MASDDWFMQAAVEATRTAKAMDAKKRAEDAERRRRDRARRERATIEARERADREAAIRGKSPGAKDALKKFGVEPPKVVEVERIVYRTKAPTADEAYDAILDHVMRQSDPFIAAGEWISRMTNGLSEIARQHMGDPE